MAVKTIVIVVSLKMPDSLESACNYLVVNGKFWVPTSSSFDLILKLSRFSSPSSSGKSTFLKLSTDHLPPNVNGTQYTGGPESHIIKNVLRQGIISALNYSSSSSSYIRLLIITMTERIMYSEKQQNISNKQEKRTTTDTSNECQYTCLYNIRTMKLLS